MLPSVPGTLVSFVGARDAPFVTASGGGGGGGVVYLWQPGVGTFADLPLFGNTVDDARLVLDTLNLYTWDGVGWEFVAYLGGTELMLPVDGGAPDTVFSTMVDGGAPDTVFTLLIDGGSA